MPVYIHIPFCARKCHYCDFHSFAGSQAQITPYLDSLERECQELRRMFGTIGVRTLYIGGGTPTLLNREQWQRLNEMIDRTFDLCEMEEYTVEMNPGTVAFPTLELLKSHGVNRISLGVQSFDRDELRSLGRIHSVEDVCKKVDMLKTLQFDNWSMDLMYGLPGQNMQTWENTLNQAMVLKPAHISAYNLKVEEGTPFYDQWQQGELDLPDEDTVIEMYEMARTVLRGNDYQHYEISNYCLHGKESKHNTAYWEHQEYLGIGSGAWSYLADTRYANPALLHDYIQQYAAATPVGNWAEFLQQKREITVCDLQCRMEDYIMLHLRIYAGISTKKFAEKFSVEFDKCFAEPLNKMLQLELMCRTDAGYRLSDKGVLLANEVMEAFFIDNLST